MTPRQPVRHAGRSALTVGVVVAVLLGGSACAGAPSASVTPVVVRLADIQSATVRVRLNQVIRIETRDPTERYSPLVADERIVTVVVRRDAASGHFEPEIVPHQVGTTQVALVGNSPLDTTGFKVIVSP